MIYSPLEQFEIKTLLIINNSWIMNISNYLIYLIIILIIINNYSYIINNNFIISNKIGLIILSIYDTILNMINNQIGIKGLKYLPLILTLFNFILIANLISMIPYSFAISAQILGIIILSLTLWLGLTILGFYTHGLKYLNLLIPAGTPLLLIPILVLIELLSYSSKALSLGLRLSANILAGHLLLIILSSLILSFMSYSFISLILSFIPLIGIIFIIILELTISCIQAYVFCILFSGYLKDAIYLH